MNRGRTNGDSRKHEPITLWIDSYSDIFSDFDPRPFSDRIVSDDFLKQLKRVSREVSGKVDVLKILVPEGKQNENEENLIRKRLENYFADKYEERFTESRQLRARASYFIISGVVLMLLASYLAFTRQTGFHINVMLVLFEPGGWFLFWTGLEGMVTVSNVGATELNFYRKMSTAHVEFASYK